MDSVQINEGLWTFPQPFFPLLQSVSSPMLQIGLQVNRKGSERIKWHRSSGTYENQERTKSKPLPNLHFRRPCWRNIFLTQPSRCLARPPNSFFQLLPIFDWQLTQRHFSISWAPVLIAFLNSKARLRDQCQRLRGVSLHFGSKCPQLHLTLTSRQEKRLLICSEYGKYWLSFQR